MRPTTNGGLPTACACPDSNLSNYRNFVQPGSVRRLRPKWLDWMRQGLALRSLYEACGGDTVDMRASRKL